MDLSKELSAFKAGKENRELAKYFKGVSYLNTLSDEYLTIKNVTFEPRCRNNWHIHHSKNNGSLTLMCVAGKGWYQEWGQKPQMVLPGDIITIKPEVKHWHGASQDSFFQHLCIENKNDEIVTEWLEAVEDTEYDKLHGRTLVVYYSMGGNTKKIAEEIGKRKGYDVVRLNPVTKYPSIFSVSLVQRVKMEVTDGYKPELEDLGVNLDDYQRVIVGTPTWWYTMTSPVLSFFSNPKLKDKTIIPFQTHGGWPGHTLDDINRVLRNSGCSVENFFQIEYDGEDPTKQITLPSEIDKWIDSL